MKSFCLLAMALHIVCCFATDPSESPAVAPVVESASAAPSVVGAKDVAVGGSNIRLSTPKTPPPRPPLPPKAPPPTSPASPQRTDSPHLLGYIFDVHSPLHMHYDRRVGPHFDDAERGDNATNITVQVGSTVNLNCRISLLQDKTVSWLRRTPGANKMELLTVGRHTYSGDSRYNVDFQYPNNWRLQIKYTAKRDEGTYECQVSTHPPRAFQVHLHINAPEVVIVDEQGNPIQDKYYEADSTIQLSCIVRHIAMTSSVVSWRHGDRVLNNDVTRGGISVRTDLMEEGANSSLSVARVNRSDAGNYTCSISATDVATVAVHVLNESLAELHHGSGGRRSSVPSVAVLVALVSTLAAAAMCLLLGLPSPPPAHPSRPRTRPGGAPLQMRALAAR